MSAKHIRTAIVAGAAALLTAVGTAIPANSGEVTVKSDLGQRALVPGTTRHAYIRVSLEGLELAERGARTPVNVALVVDKSGSMGGAKIEQAREAAVMALNRLGGGDTASVVAYNDEVDVLVPATRVGTHGEMADQVRRLRAGGRTALYAGTQQGVREVRKYLTSNRVNRVILLSDGLANVGPSRPEDLARLARDVVQDGISVTTIGLGLGYNEDLMAKLAYNSDGNHAFVERADQLVEIFNREFGDVLSVVAQDVIITIECRNGFVPKRVLGRKAEVDGNRIRMRLNQLYATQEKYVILEVEVPAGMSPGDVAIADVAVDYRSMAAGERRKLRSAVNGRITKSVREAEASVDKRVMTSVTTQIANVRNERAVKLRDAGRIKEAKKLLQDNAAYLGRAAASYSAPELEELKRKNQADAAAVAQEGEWAKTRKSMRARQHKLKVQQSY